MINIDRVNNVFVMLDNNVGTVIASETKLDEDRYLACDGRVINHTDYSELFYACECKKETLKVPDYRYILNGKIYFYLVAK